MNIGGLYTYPALRYVYKDVNHIQEGPQGPLAWIDIDELFVVLEVKNDPSLDRVKGNLAFYKVLTIKGIVGWTTGVFSLFQELKAEP